DVLHHRAGAVRRRGQIPGRIGSMRMNDVQWDETVDVVVLGSGAAGMSAALTCHFEGLRVLLLEKTDRIGGSTAVSGGAVWIPLNPGAAAAGHGDDTIEQDREYQRRTVGDASPPERQQADLDDGPAMVENLKARGALADRKSVA